MPIFVSKRNYYILMRISCHYCQLYKTTLTPSTLKFIWTESFFFTISLGLLALICSCIRDRIISSDRMLYNDIFITIALSIRLWTATFITTNSIAESIFKGTNYLVHNNKIFPVIGYIIKLVFIDKLNFYHLAYSNINYLFY